MATAMGFAHVGFLVLLCLSYCSARRVLTDSSDAEKPNIAPSNFQDTQSTGGISSLGDSKWQSGGKGSHGSGGGGGGGGGGGNCEGNEGCGGCGNFGGGGSYYGGCANFGCDGGFGGGYCGGNGGCGCGCGYACGDGGNYQGGCYYPPPPTCCTVSCPPVSNCCPVGCSSGYGQHKVAAQRWANWQATPKPQVRWHHSDNSQVPPSPEMAHSQVTPNPQDSHDEHKTYIKKTENDEIHSEPKLNADDSKPSHSDKERQLEQMTELDGKNQAEQPGSDGQMQEDVSKN